MPLMNDLQEYSADEYITSSELANTNFKKIHKKYTPIEIRYALCYPIYNEMYNKLKDAAYFNTGCYVNIRQINKFKTGVQLAYPNGCPITGVPNKLTDLAHILPYSVCAYYEQDDPENGLRLDIHIHRLWDSSDNWLELVIVDDILGIAEFKIPKRHIGNKKIEDSVSAYIDRPLKNLSINTMNYIKKRLNLDSCG